MLSVLLLVGFGVWIGYTFRAEIENFLSGKKDG